MARVILTDEDERLIAEAVAAARTVATEGVEDVEVSSKLDADVRQAFVASIRRRSEIWARAWIVMTAARDALGIDKFSEDFGVSADDVWDFTDNSGASQGFHDATQVSDGIGQPGEENRMQVIEGRAEAAMEAVIAGRRDSVSV